MDRLAYTRTQAAEALGVSRSTFNKRVLPLIETVVLPWGTKLVPANELEPLIAEQRLPPRAGPEQTKRGRPRVVSSDIVDEVRAAREAGQTFRQIASGLNERSVPTAHGGVQWWPSTVRGGPSPIRRPVAAERTRKPRTPTLADLKEPEPRYRRRASSARTSVGRSTMTSCSLRDAESLSASS